MEVEVGVKMDIPLPLFYLFTLLLFKTIVQHEVLNFPFNSPL